MDEPFIQKCDTRGPRKMDEVFRAASDGVSLILFQKGHPAPRVTAFCAIRSRLSHS